jgi:hypothetical protein
MTINPTNFIGKLLLFQLGKLIRRHGSALVLRAMIEILAKSGKKDEVSLSEDLQKALDRFKGKTL